MADNPDWPNQALLARRLQDALAVEGDDATVLAICAAQKPRDTPSMLRCADADTNAGRAPDAAEIARQAWISGITDPAAETGFLRRWGHELTASDQWRRFDRLAWSDSAAPGGPAERQIARLDPAQRPAAEARLALRRDDPAARILLANTAAAARAADPALMLEQAKWLRRANKDDEAQAVWLIYGQAAERAAPPERKPAYWAEREVLARRRLRDGDPSGAYALVDQTVQTAVGPLVDSEFLAGFIALRRLGDLGAAERHFLTLVTLSKAAITQGRAYSGWAAPPMRGTTQRRRTRPIPRPPPGRPPSTASLPPGRWARATPNSPPASAPCMTRTGRRSTRWTSWARIWRAPPPCWSNGTNRAAPAPSCCGWRSRRGPRPTGPWPRTSPPGSACRIWPSPWPAAPDRTG